MWTSGTTSSEIATTWVFSMNLTTGMSLFFAIKCRHYSQNFEDTSLVPGPSSPTFSFVGGRKEPAKGEEGLIATHSHKKHVAVHVTDFTRPSSPLAVSFFPASYKLKVGEEALGT